MSQTILLRGARQVLTLRGKPGVRRGPLSGHLEIIEDGSVLIQGGKIVSVGSTRRLENLKEVRGAIDVPVQNCIVMPGFVDPSIRLSLSAPRGGDEGAGRRKLSDFFNDSLNLMRSCLQHGTLNAVARACSGVRSLGADLSVLRQIARMGNSTVGLKRVWCPETDGEAMPDAQTLAHALEVVSKQKLADAIELKGHPMADEAIVRAAARADIKLSFSWPGGSADDLRERLDRSCPASVYCHPNVTATEQAVLAKTDATAVFTAGGALLDSQPGASVRDLVEAGAAVAVGSGYDAEYEPNFNMQMVLALAVRRLKLTIEQALVATTINAAYAMNSGEQIGSLEPGKRADVLVLNLPDYREIPRRLGVNHVAMAIRNGEIAINRTRWKVGAA